MEVDADDNNNMHADTSAIMQRVRRLSEEEKKEAIDTCVLYLYSDFLFLEDCPQKPVVSLYFIVFISRGNFISTGSIFSGHTIFSQGVAKMRKTWLIILTDILTWI